MPKKKYTPEFKTKIIIAILQGDKEFNAICAEHKAALRKENDLKKNNDRMLKTIGQLTLERDSLQDCFRIAGEPIPKLPEYDSKE